MTDRDREIGELRASIVALRDATHELLDELRVNERMTRAERAAMVERISHLEVVQRRTLERLIVVEEVTTAVTRSRAMIVGGLVVLGTIGSFVSTIAIVAGEKIMHWLGIK